MADFDRDTRVVEHATGFRATLSADWNIWGPNGGYLSTIALRAVGCRAAIPRPVAFYGHYLRVARFDAVEIEVVTLASGKRTESFDVKVHQDAKLVLVALVRTAREGDGVEHVHGTPPSVPEPEMLPEPAALVTPLHPKPRPFWDNLDTRVIQPERFAMPRPTQDPHWLEWYRFKPGFDCSDPFLDAGRSLLLLDTMTWPSVALRHPGSPFIAPSLDLAAWFHQSGSDSDWLLAEAESPIGQQGIVSSQMRVWSRDRRLLSSGGTHLLCTPVPTG